MAILMMMMIATLLEEIFDTLINIIIINNTTIEMRGSPLEVEIVVEEKYRR
jgi:hypothetical protein